MVEPHRNWLASSRRRLKQLVLLFSPRDPQGQSAGLRPSCCRARQAAPPSPARLGGRDAPSARDASSRASSCSCEPSCGVDTSARIQITNSHRPPRLNNPGGLALHLRFRAFPSFAANILRNPVLRLNPHSAIPLQKFLPTQTAEVGLSDVDALTIVLAALGAICVASAVLLILELSDPYSGLFRMPHEGFDGFVRLLTKGAETAADGET